MAIEHTHFAVYAWQATTNWALSAVHVFSMVFLFCSCNACGIYIHCTLVSQQCQSYCHFDAALRRHDDEFCDKLQEGVYKTHLAHSTHARLRLLLHILHSHLPQAQCLNILRQCQQNARSGFSLAFVKLHHTIPLSFYHSLMMTISLISSIHAFCQRGGASGRKCFYCSLTANASHTRSEPTFPILHEALLTTK